MGNLSHTVGVTDNLVSFKSAARVPIDSLKVHFKPIQEGEGDPSPENIRPIRGWNEVEAYKSGKNIAHVFGYSAQSADSLNGNLKLTNNYGTTISITQPEKSVEIIQSQWPNSDQIYHFQNGYFIVVVDNLQYGLYYDVSFKISDISNNPLNAALSSIRLAPPNGRGYAISDMLGDTIIFKNILYGRHSSAINRTGFTIYNCGMSFTLSEFMVTPVGMNDGVFEPYCGEVIPVTFPVIGKNLIDSENPINVQYLERNGAYYTNTHTDTRDHFQFYVDAYSNSEYLGPIKSLDIVTTGFNTTTFTLHEKFATMTHIRIKHNGSKADFAFRSPCKLIVGQTYTVSLDVTSNDPTTVGGLSFGKIQLELGSEATAYEPYNPDNTIYGGYVDLAKGEVVAEWIKVEKKLSECSVKNERNGYVCYDFHSLSDIPCYANATITPHTIRKEYSMCSLGYHSWSAFDNLKPHYYIFKNEDNNTTRALLFLPIESIESDDTEFELAFRLEVPIHYPLTPTQLKTFLNNNTFWSNTNNVTEVSYAVHDTAPIRAAKKRIIAASPHLEAANNDLINFNTDIAAPLKECKVEFKPKQDLHGYDRPWVGGAGKNLFNENAIIYGTWTAADGSIQSSSPGCRTEDIAVNPGETYTAMYNGEQPYSESLIELDENKNFILRTHIGWQGTSNPNVLHVTLTENTRYIYLQVYHHDIGTNTMTKDVLSTYRMQLEKGSVASSYEPYENICPIDGWTNIDLYKSGKNLIHLPVMTRTTKGITWTINEDGSIHVDGTASSNAWMSNWSDDSQHVDFYLRAGTYVLSRNGTPAVKSIYFVARDGSTTKDIGQVTKEMTNSATFTLSQDTLVGFQAAVTPDQGEIHTIVRPQLESLSFTNYEAPNNSMIPITFPAEAGTIYGGYVDLVNGEIVQEWEMAIARWGDMKTQYVSSTTGYYAGRISFNNRIVVSHSQSDYGVNSICNVLNKVSWNDGDIKPEHYYSGNGQIGDDLKGMAYLYANYPDDTVIQIAARLADPIHYPIDSQTLKNLRGVNNIWSTSNGPITIKYWKH